MITRHIAVLGGFVLFFVSMCAAATVTITIDQNTRYQTIIGFGGRPGGVGSAAQIADMLDSNGMSVVRLDACDGATGSLDEAKSYYAHGCHQIIGSCWSPPASMKTNGNIAGGSLASTQYDAFATYLVSMLTKFKKDYGAEMFAISPQNEPQFAEFYGSCVYTGTDLVQVTKLLGQKIKAAGLHTKIFFPEDIYQNWNSALKLFIRPLVMDTEAKSYVYALAFHGAAADFNPDSLQRMYALAKANGWQLWQSENADVGGDNGMGAANPPIHTAQETIDCLRYGKVQMYMKYGVIADNATSVEYYIATGNRTQQYYMTKIFNRFIRPGAVQLRSITSDSVALSRVVAFYDSAAATLTVTFVTGASTVPVQLSGVNLPSTFQMWVCTSGQLSCTMTGTPSSTSAISLPANSAVSLFGSNYTGSSVKMPLGRIGMQAAAERESFYELTGKRISTANALNRTAHMVIIVTGNSAKLRMPGMGQ